MSVRTPPDTISMGTPSRKASPTPLSAWVMPAAGTMASTPIESVARLMASAMKAPPPSCVTSTGVIDLEPSNSS